MTWPEACTVITEDSWICSLNLCCILFILDIVTKLRLHPSDPLLGRKWHALWARALGGDSEVETARWRQWGGGHCVFRCWWSELEMRGFRAARPVSLLHLWEGKRQWLNWHFLVFFLSFFLNWHGIYLEWYTQRLKKFYIRSYSCNHHLAQVTDISSTEEMELKTNSPANPECLSTSLEEKENSFIIEYTLNSCNTYHRQSMKEIAKIERNQPCI